MYFLISKFVLFNFSIIQSKTNHIIYVSFYIKSDKICFSTGVECPVAHYEPLSGRVLPSEKHYKDKNLILANIEARVCDVFVKFKLRDRTLTKESFLKEYNRPSDYNDFFAYVENYIRRTRITMEENTIQVHRTAMKNLKEYKPDLTFDDITEDFLNCFLHYLKKTRGMQDNTAYKKIGVIKKYVRAAYREGYMTIDPFQNFRVKKSKSTSFCYLTEEEVQKLYDYYKSPDINERDYYVLQFFLWMVFSSQHISDVRKTKIEDIYSEHLHYYRTKLRNSKPMLLRIPVSQPLQNLYNDARENRTKGYLFRHIPSDQKVNKRLKTIAVDAGINKPITAKTGRHTFATFFLAKTQQLTTLKELLGHTHIEETLIYAHVLDESKINGVACFNSIQ